MVQHVSTKEVECDYENDCSDYNDLNKCLNCNSNKFIKHNTDNKKSYYVEFDSSDLPPAPEIKLYRETFGSIKEVKH